MILVGDARYRDAEHIFQSRIEVRPVAELRQVLALKRQCRQVLA